MNLHPGEPFERGGRDVVIIANARDGWVGIKAAEDWVLNLVLVDAGEVSGLGSIREYDECLIEAWLKVVSGILSKDKVELRRFTHL